MFCGLWVKNEGGSQAGREGEGVQDQVCCGEVFEPLVSCVCLTLGGGSTRVTFGYGFLSGDVMDNSRGEGKGALGFRQNETWHHALKTECI